MELSQARTLADALAQSMRPYVVKGMIAGSIRRQKPEVKDIELVVVPKWGTRKVDDLFGDSEVPDNLLHSVWSEQITKASGEDIPRLEWIKPGTPDILPWYVKPDGRYWRGYLPDHNVKVDIFIARRDTFGTIAMMRTGAADFSAAMFAKAKQVGYQNVEGELHRHGRQVPVPEERDVFRLLSVAWVEPKDRTGPDAVKRLPAIR